GAPPGTASSRSRRRYRRAGDSQHGRAEVVRGPGDGTRDTAPAPVAWQRPRGPPDRPRPGAFPNCIPSGARTTGGSEDAAAMADTTGDAIVGSMKSARVARKEMPTGFCGTACTTYQSCDIQGQNCGIIADGCGGTLDDRRPIGDLMSMPRGVVLGFSLTLTVAVSVTANLQ